MIKVEKFRREHFEAIRHDQSAACLIPHLSKEHLERLETLPYAFAGMKDGKVLFCAGLSEYWPNRAEAWTVLSKETAPHMVEITRIIKNYLDVVPVRRIEASVDVDYKKGHKWMRLLGFQLEAKRLRAYLPDGEDCALYARVRY